MDFREIRFALQLIGKRRATRYWILVGIQSFVGLLDLVAVTLLGVVVLTGTGGTAPAAIAHLFSNFLIQNSGMAQIAVGAAIAVGLLLLRSILSFVLMRATYQFLGSCQTEAARRLLRTILNKPRAGMGESISHEYAYAVTGGIAALMTGMLGQLATALSEFFLLTILISALLVFDPVLTLGVITYFVLVAGSLSIFLSRRAKRIGEALSTQQVMMTESISDILFGHRELVASGRIDGVIQKFNKMRQSYSLVNAESYVLGQISKYILELALIVGAGTLLLLQLAFKPGPDALGTVAVFLLAGSRIMPSLVRLQTSWVGIRTQAGEALPAVKLIQVIQDGNEAHGHDPETLSGVASAQTATRSPERSNARLLIPEVRLSTVSFRYSESDPLILDQVELHVLAGEFVAIVGPSGSGKSTLMDVILGINAPTSGTVEISGMEPLAAACEWPGAIGYLPQSPRMIANSIAANVAFGISESDIDLDRVMNALSFAGLEDVVESLPSGLMTNLGEAASRLSGGQRQRIGIARVAYAQPKLVLVDEGTSSLDHESEEVVVAALEAMRGKSTLIVVSHRARPIQAADRIFVLSEARLRKFDG